ncbi:MAG: aconitase X catalytic domain-containing protein [Candidatus Odinarchaeia archaeon]
MFLTKEEEKMLDGEYGLAVQKSMKLITALGDIFGAEKLIPVSKCQISGVSFKNIGDVGLSFIEDLAELGAEVKTVATLNPAGMDLLEWRKLGISEDFAKKQMRIINAFKKMGVVTSCSCTPYLTGNLPTFREHVGWAESSAVSFANSVIGARTNREGGPVSVAIAITGRTPYYGYHLDENRLATNLVKIKFKPKDVSDYSLIGYYVGKNLGTAVPVFEGLKAPSLEGFKALGAGAAASGAIALYHVIGFTPEAPSKKMCRNLEKIEIGVEEINSMREELNKASDIDIVTLGCPHASIGELMELARKLKGRKIKDDKKLWICTSRVVKNIADKIGCTRIIEKAGGIVAADTCMVVAPLEEMNFKGLATNSSKAAHYVPSTCKIPTSLMETDECLRTIVKN